MRTNYIECGDCLQKLKTLPDNSIDMIITSPPYDGLREYNGYSFDFENIAKELYRVLKPGSAMVWIVNDATVNGSETGTSFRQVLFFMELGFNLHDTMIWNKGCSPYTNPNRYYQCFEYMFVLSKGKLTKYNLIKDRRNKYGGTTIHGKQREADGTLKSKTGSGISKRVNEYGARLNIWDLPGEKGNTTGHPAVFPVQLVLDHLTSWSDAGDIVLDPFMGSGTTAIACVELGRDYIGFDISEEYCASARQRVLDATNKIKLW